MTIYVPFDRTIEAEMDKIKDILSNSELCKTKYEMPLILLRKLVSLKRKRFVIQLLKMRKKRNLKE